MLAFSLATLSPCVPAASAGTVPVPFDGASFIGTQTPSQVRAVYTADLNLDGRPDVVVLAIDTTCSMNCVGLATWYLMQSDGSLLPAGTLRCPDSNYDSALIADLTGDGLPDLVLTSDRFDSTPAFLGSTVRLYPGDGAGHFGTPIVVASGADGPVARATYDFDGDGLQDLVLHDQVGDGAWSIVRGTGGGQFAPFCAPALTDRPTGWVQIALGDVTGDGRPDLVALAPEGVDVFTIPLAGGTPSPIELGGPGTPGAQLQLLLGDLDGDGLVDIVRTTDSPDAGFYYIRSLGGGIFKKPIRSDFSEVLFGLDLADLDGDGKAEILLQFNEKLDVYRFSGTAPIVPPSVVRSGGVLTALAVDDVDKDGRLDVWFGTSGSGGPSLELHRNTGGGAFVGHEIAGDAGPVALLVTDLDGDGHADIVEAAAGANDILLLYGDGSGQFNVVRRLPAGGHVSGLAAARTWSGGGVDLFTSEQSDNTVSQYRNLGGRTFAPRVARAVPPGPSGVAVGDVTGDGVPDLVTTNSGSNLVSVFAGDGAGGFAPRVDLGAGSGPRAPLIADLDGDGLGDLAYALEFQDAVGVRLASAAGLGPEVAAVAATRPRRLVAADLDHDGLPELISAGDQGTSVFVAHGDPANHWPVLSTLPTGTGVTGLALVDCDGDAQPDLVAARTGQPSGTQSVALEFGGNGGAFSPRVELGLGLSVAALASGDLDGDGRPDLVAANAVSASTSTISILLNRASGPIVSVPAWPERPGVALAVTRLVPNPSHGALSAEVRVARDGVATARVVSLAGRSLWEQRLTLHSGTQLVPIAVGEKLPPGVYWLDVRQGGPHTARKFVVLP